MGRSRLRVVPLSAKITELINSTTGIYLQAPKPSLHPTQQRPGGVAPTDPQQVSLSFSKGGSPRERPGQWAVTWRALGSHRVLYTEDCCLPFQPIFQPRLSPSAPRFSGFPASCQPDAPPSGAPWTAALQAPPSMGFSRQEYWSGVPLPSPAKELTI